VHKPKGLHTIRVAGQIVEGNLDQMSPGKAKLSFN
jgi:hypothetical protein